MKPKIMFSISILLMLYTATVHAQAVGALTIFSEDGDKFFLILNGQRQNEVAKTNVRVDGLNQPNYNAKIIFENTALPEISKNYLAIADPQNGTMMDITYKIKHDKNGNPKMPMMPSSYIPYQQSTSPPTDAYVVHYGAPAATSVSQTTTTTTAVVPSNAVNVNMNGVNMDIKVTDPNMNATTVQTTTTRTTTTTTEGYTGNAQSPPPAQVGCKGAWPMNAGDFSSAMATIKGQGFDETKLSTAKQIAGGNCLSANQVADICKTFGFEETKLNFAKYAYDHCTEPQNYFKINNVFGFSSSVDDLNKYIQSK